MVAQWDYKIENKLHYIPAENQEFPLQAPPFQPELRTLECLRTPSLALNSFLSTLSP